MSRTIAARPRATAAAALHTRVTWPHGEPRIWLDLEASGVAALSARLGAGTAEAHESVYFDGRGLVLRRAGVTLAVVRRGRRFVQVVTFPLQADAVERLVHEADLASPQPDRRHLLAVLPGELAAAVGELALERLFALRYTRAQAGFPAAAPVLDVVLDRGIVQVGTTETNFAELALRNRRGVDAPGAAARLLADVPVRLAAEDRWERGYRIAAGHAPVPYDACLVPVPADASLGEAAERVLRQAFEHFIRNLPAASLRGESEAIHQMRVGMRRLTACTAIFPRLLDADLIRDVGALRRLFESLAEVRECDVFLEATLPEVALNTVAAVDRSAFEVAVRLHRASALGSLRRAFDGGDLAVLVSVLALRLEGRGWSARRQPLDEFTAALGAREFAVRRIRALHRRLIDATPRDRADVAGWHAARKRAKKLRYAAEPLRLTHPAKARKTQRYARRLGQLQEMLGDLNDLRTAGALMARLDATANAELGTPMRIIRDAVYAHVAARTQRLLPKVARALKRVRAAAPRLPRALRRPQAVAIVGTAPAPTAWVATQVAAAWASAGLRTGVCAAKVLPAVRAWLAQRSDKQPRIERLRRKELPAPKRLQRVAIAQPVPKRAKGWRRLRKEADVVVLVVAADAAAGTADVLTRARKAGVEPLIVATAVGAAPPIDAVTTLRWRKVEQSQMRRGAGPFAAGRANKVAAHSAWLPLLTALERRL